MSYKKLSPQEVHEISTRAFKRQMDARWKDGVPLNEAEADRQSLYEHARVLEAELRDRDYKAAVASFVGMTIHHMDDSEHNSGHLACLGWHGWDPIHRVFPPPPHPEVHRAGDKGYLFTHEKRLVTCAACKKTWSYPIIEVATREFGKDVWRKPEDDPDQWKRDAERYKQFEALGYPHQPGHRPADDEDDNCRVYWVVVPDGNVQKAKRRILCNVTGVESVREYKREEDGG